MKGRWILRAFFLSLLIGGLLIGCSKESKTSERRDRPGYFTPGPEDQSYTLRVAETLKPMCFKMTGGLHAHSIVQMSPGACSENFEAKYAFGVREIDQSQIRNIRRPNPQWELLVGEKAVGRVISQRILGERGYEIEYWISEFCSGSYELACEGLSL